jgi:predicted transcriptional regulator of viral defense system
MTDKWPLTWAERRILYRIEAEQELVEEHKGFTPKLNDLAYLVGMQPKACRAIISGLVEKGYIAHKPRGRRVWFDLLKPLGGQYRLQWQDGKSEFVRAF